MYACKCKAEFSAKFPLLQSSVSHDPSKIILIFKYSRGEHKTLLVKILIIPSFCQPVYIHKYFIHII